MKEAGKTMRNSLFVYDSHIKSKQILHLKKKKNLTFVPQKELSCDSLPLDSTFNTQPE